MRLLNSSDLALRVVILLGREPQGERMNVETIAERLGGLSRNHLHKIVQELVALGVLRTVRGAGGGVALAAPLDRVRLGWLIRSLEAGQPLAECFRTDGGCCSLEPGCMLRRALYEARETFYRSLDTRTLADCVGVGRRTSARAGRASKAKRDLGPAKQPPRARSGRRIAVKAK